MISLVLSFSVFIITAVFHFLVFRLNTKGRSILAAFIIFLAGFLLDVFLISNIGSLWMIVPLPFSSVTFYLLLSASYLIYISSVILADKSPSNTIIETLLVEGKASDKKLIDKLTAKNFIEKRLSEMVRVGLIQKNKNKYKLTRKSRVIAKLFIYYRALYKWDRGG